jgi:hypothetical protein
MEYKILFESTRPKLECQVNFYIKEYGYKPKGGVTYCEKTGWLLQAIIK